MGAPHGEKANKAVDAILDTKDAGTEEFRDMIEGINRNGCGFHAIYIEDIESASYDFAWLRGYIAGKENDAQKARQILDGIENLVNY